MPARTETVVLKFEGQSASAAKAIDQIVKSLMDLGRQLNQVQKSTGGLKFFDAFRQLGRMVGGIKGTALSALGSIGKGILNLFNPLKLVTAGFSGLGGIIQTALGVTAGNAISMLIGRLKELATQPVLLAARVEVLENVFYFLGQRAGYAKDELSGFLEGLKETGITTREAAQNLTRMIQAQLDLSKASELARVAQDAAVISGENSSEAFAGIMHGIVSLNTRILRHRGIFVDLQAAYERFAAAAGTTADALSTHIKQQIALDEVIRSGAAIAGAYTTAMDFAGKKITSLKRYAEEAAVALGRSFLPILGQGIDIVSDLLKKAETLFVGAQPALTAFSERMAAGMGQAWNALVAGVTTVRPYLQELGEILGVYLPRIASRLKLLWVDLKNTFAAFGATVGGYLPSLSQLWTFFTDTVKASLDSVLKLLDGFRFLLKGQGEQAAAAFTEAMANGLAFLIILWQDYVSKALAWGYNLVSQFAQGMIDAASQWITAAVEYVGNLINQFLGAFSPPQKGILSGIVKWGQGLINEYFKGFLLADFGVLDQVGSAIKNALQAAVNLGDLPEKQLMPTFRKVRELAAGLIATFRKTGEISEEALGQISQVLGEGGQELVKYIRLQLEHQKALKDLADVEKEYAEAEAKGFVPAELKKRLANAKAQAEEAKEQLSWQEALVKAQQDTVDIQVEQLSATKQLVKAMRGVAGAVGTLGKAIEPAADPWAKFVEGYEEDLAVLEEKRRLGLISEEEYLKGLEALQSRYVEQAIRMGKPYDVQLAALRRLREELESADVGVAEPAFDFDLTFPEPDMEQFKRGIDRGVEEAFAGVSERFAEAKEQGKQLISSLLSGAREAIADFPGLITRGIVQGWDALRVRFPVIDEFITKIKSAATDLVTFFAPAIENVKIGFRGLVTELAPSLPYLRSLYDVVVAFAPTALELARVIGGVLLIATKAWLDSLAVMLPAIGAIITGLVVAATSVITGFLHFVQGAFQMIKNLILGNMEEARAGAVLVWTGLVEAAVGLIVGMSHSILAAAKGLVDGIVEFFMSLYDSLVGGSIVPDLVDKMLSLWDELYTSTIGKLATLVKDAIAKLAEFRDRGVAVAEEARGWIAEKIGGIADSFIRVKTAIEEAIGKLGEFLSNLAGAVIPDWLMPGSATPFELGLWGILGVMQQLATYAEGFFVFQNMRTDLEVLTTILIPAFVQNTVAQFTDLKLQVTRLVSEMTSQGRRLIQQFATDAYRILATFAQRVKQLFTDLKTTLIQLVKDTIDSILEQLQRFYDEAGVKLEETAAIFEDMASRMASAIDEIGDQIARLNKKLDKLIEKAREAEKAMQDAGLLGESPPRFETSLEAINLALRRVQATLGGFPMTMQYQAMMTAATVPETRSAATGNIFQFYEGAFAGAFPGVRDGRGAGDFLTELNYLLGQAAARAEVPGGTK